MSSEDTSRLLLIGGTVAAIALALGLIAFGYWYSVIRERNRTVVQVDDIKVSYSAMKRRLEYEFFSNVSYQSRAGVAALPQIAYDNLVEELTLVSRAETELGVSYSPEEFQAKLRAKVGAGDEADAQTFADRLREALDASGLNRTEYERIARAELLRDKARAKFQNDAPEAVPQARLDVIVVSDPAIAETALARVRGGEDWATVARELSIEPDVVTTGGVKDYGPEDTFPAAYDDFAFSGNIGDISDPLTAEGSSTLYIVRITDRADRPLTEDQLGGYASRAFNKWLTDTQAAVAVKDNWTEDIEAQSDAVSDLYVLALEREQQQQQPPIQQPVITVTAPDTPAAGATPPAEATSPAAPTSAAPVPTVAP